jgi:hypothetical protein
MRKGAMDHFEVCSNTWQEYVDKKDFHAAIGVALEAYTHYRATQDERIARGCLNLVCVATGLLQEAERVEEISVSCSFCGKSQNEIRLFSGPDVYICNECVSLFHELSSQPLGSE